LSSVAPFTASIAAMYQDGLLAHHRAPHNRRVIDSPTASGARKNPVCGDEITVMVVLDADAVGDTVADVAFTGRGCSIATASASMMTDAVAGLPVSEALAVADAVDRMLHASGAEASAESGLPPALTPLLGVAPFPGRHGCAMLPWQALREALTAKR
jgi:nitrogen fixation NifU-like protein